MSDDLSIQITDKTYEKIIKTKERMGFSQKTWDEWFNALLADESSGDSDKDTIEKIIRKNAYHAWHEEWIRNFSINLPYIWEGHSASELAPPNGAEKSSALVIGRGPSIKKHKQLELLADSGFKGAIVCADGALPNVLEAGITPDRFNLFTLTIDAQENQKKLYEHPITKKFGRGVKCLISTTAHPKVYEAAKNANMNIYWLHTLFDYEGAKNSFNKIQGIMTRAKSPTKKVPAIQTGANVGTSAWVVSWSILRCAHVGLIGIDLGYDGDTPWEQINYHGYSMPKDIDVNSESFKRAYPTVYNPDFRCYCKQDPLFLYYCNALKEFIQKVQHRVKTINATEGGALFGEGITCTTLADFLQNYNFKV